MQRPMNLWVRSILGIFIVIYMLGLGPIRQADAAGPITLTTYADFTATGSAFSDTAVHEDGTPTGASIILNSTNFEDFGGTSLDPAVWTAGLWTSGAFNPNFAASIVTIPQKSDAYIHSNSMYARPGVSGGAVTVEFLAKFNSTPASKESAINIGFGLPDLNYQYIVFSTFDPREPTRSINTGKLYAKIKNNANDAIADLGFSYIGGYHRFRIDWLALPDQQPGGYPQDEAIFYVDGLQVADLTFANTNPPYDPMLHLFTYISNKSMNDDLSVDWIRVFPAYKASGTYTSPVLYAGSGNVFKTISWAGNQPVGTLTTVETSSSPDNVNWSAFSAVTSGGHVVNNGRYIKYRVTLNTSTSTLTPQVDSVTFDIGSPSADMSLDNSTFPPYVHSGGTYTSSYTFAVTNNGPDSATGVTVTDLLPATLTYTGMVANPDWSCTAPPASTVICSYTRNGGLLASGSPAQMVTINVTGTGGTNGSALDNIATVSSTADSNASNNNSTATTHFTKDLTDLSLTMTGPAVSGVGRQLSYYLQVVNGDSVPAPSVKLVDIVPAGMTNISAKYGLDWTCNVVGQIVTCDRLQTLAGSSSATGITIQATAPITTGTLQNTANVSAAIGDSNLANNTASVTTKVATLTFLPTVQR